MPSSYTVSPVLNIPVKPSPFAPPKTNNGNIPSNSSKQNNNIPAGTAIGSSQGGGVIRSDGKGGTYIDRTTTPEQGAKEWHRHNNYNKQPQSSPNPALHTPAPVPQSATYVPEAKGVVTSTGKVYQTTNKDWRPAGYEEGFADVRQSKDGTSVVVVPKATVSETKATKEGAQISETIIINRHNTGNNNGVRSSADTRNNSGQSGNISNLAQTNQNRQTSETRGRTTTEILAEEIVKVQSIIPSLTTGVNRNKVQDELRNSPLMQGNYFVARFPSVAVDIFKSGSRTFVGGSSWLAEQGVKPIEKYITHQKADRIDFKKELPSSTSWAFEKPSASDVIQTGIIGATYYAGPIVQTVLGTSFGTVQVAKAIKDSPTSPVGQTAADIVMGAGLTYSQLREISIYGKEPYQVLPTKEVIDAVQPFTGRSQVGRPTLMLKDSDGNYIFGKTQSGEIISFGGKAEKGETARQALFRELREETGLTKNDLSNLKYQKTVVFPEETYKVYTAQIKPTAKFNPSSDIKSIVRINPDSVFIKGTTGQTATQPISRIVPIKGTSFWSDINPIPRFGKLRAYEAGMINLLERGMPVTWLKLDTKLGPYYLGTQSRYDVPYKSQKQFTDKEVLLAHGTPSPAILKRLPIGKQKEFTIEASKTQRGQAQGLYLQPPAAPKQVAPGYIGLSYLGFSTTQEAGIKVGWPTRTVYTMKEKVSGPIGPTPKTFSGMEEEFIVKPGNVIQTAGRYEVASIGFKKVYIQPTKVKVADGSEFEFIAMKTPEGNYKYVNPLNTGLRISSSSSPSRSTPVNNYSISNSVTSFKSTSSYPSTSYSIKPSITPSISKQPSQSVSTSLSTSTSIASYISKASYTGLSKGYSLGSSASSFTYHRGGSSTGKKFRFYPLEKPKSTSIGYRTFVIKNDRKVYLPGIRTEGFAKMFGESYVMKNLRATFGISKTAGVVSGPNVNYTPNKQMFRDYRIKNKQIVPQENLWIQRLGKRLSSYGERSEIQAARRNR